MSALVGEAETIRIADPQRSRALAIEALAMARSNGDEKGAADALTLVAYADLSLSSFASGTEAAAEAVAIYRRLDSRRGLANSLNISSVLHRRLGDAEAALRDGLEGLRLSREVGDPYFQAFALQGLGNFYRFQGENERSLEHHEESLAIAVRIGSGYDEASALLGIGNCYEKLGRFQEAIDVYRRSMAIAAAIGDARLQAYASGNIGIGFERLGQYANALVYELESLRWKQQLDDRWGIGVSYNNLGVIYRSLGDYASALEALFMSLEVSEEIGDEQGVSIALNNIGETYMMLGDRTHVLDFFLRSLKISQSNGHRQGEAFSLNHIGSFYNHLNDGVKALLHYFRSLRILEASGDRSGVRELLRNIGGIYRSIGDSERAKEYLTRSLDLAISLQDPLGEFYALLELGSLQVSTGAHEEGIGLLLRSLQVARAMESKDLTRHVGEALAIAYADAGQPDNSSLYRKLYQQMTQELFGEEATLRVREMLVRFEGKRVRKEGEQLGLLDEDIEEISAAMRRQTRVVLPPREQGRAAVHGPAAAHPVRTVPGMEAAMETGTIRVRTFGAFRVTVNGKELGTSDWKRKKARDLFKLLLLHHGRAITIDQILEKLWDGTADKRSDMLVMNAVSHLRRAVEPERLPHRTSSILSSSDRAYTLYLGEGAEIDFLRFKELIVAARRSASAGERRARYEAAIALYQGDFLQEDLYEEWSAAERGLLKDALLEAMEYLAGDALRDGRYEETIQHARAILEHDNTSERAYELWLLSLRERGRTGEARKIHAECVKIFRSELGADPPERLARLAAFD